MSKQSNALSLNQLQKLQIWVSARFLPLAIAHKSFDQIARYAHAEKSKLFVGASSEKIAAHILKVTKRPWLMRDRRCLRQGILGMRFLAKSGFKPVLKFGVDVKSIADDKLSAHCWVEIDGRAVLNDEMENMVVIYSVPEGHA